MATKIFDLPNPSRANLSGGDIVDLTSGGGGGDFGGMEQRLESLEKRMDTLENRMEGLDTRLRGVEVKLGAISGKISMLPGYPGIAVIMTIVGGALLVVSRLFPDGPP